MSVSTYNRLPIDIFLLFSWPTILLFSWPMHHSYAVVALQIFPLNYCFPTEELEDFNLKHVIFVSSNSLLLDFEYFVLNLLKLKVIIIVS